MEKMSKYTLYIGSNNRTHQLERDEIVRISRAFFEAFTYQEGEGFYKGKPESCAILTVFTPSTLTDDVAVKALASALRGDLNQECILVVHQLVEVDYI